MFLFRKNLLITVLICFSIEAKAADSPLAEKKWAVDGVDRQALVYVPSGIPRAGAPVIFVFHGHGGTMRFSSRADYQGLWPEAIVIYPQGLPTPGHLTDPEGKRPGWQFGTGEQGDRDLKFFDAMLTTAMHDYHANPKWVFVTGHSNGARFSQLLWATRGDKLTAVAASASSALNLAGQYKPKPYLQISGEKDPLVPFALQKASFNSILKVNGCTSPGQAEKNFTDGNLTRYSSTLGAPTFLLLHQGGHTITSEGPAMITEFFKASVRP